jgi:hypothetical protein
MRSPGLLGRFEVPKNSRRDLQMPVGESVKIGRRLTLLRGRRLRPLYFSMPDTPAGPSTIPSNAPVFPEATFQVVA